MFKKFYFLLRLIKSFFISLFALKKRCDSVDILFILFYEGGAKRVEPLVMKLEERGLVCKVVDRNIETYFRLKEIKFSFVFWWRPLIFIFNYMCTNYNPKVICVMEDNLPKEVHRFLKRRGTILCNLAHCPTASSSRFSSIHYDHYFCFGGLSKRRLEYLKKRHVDEACQLHESGSPFWQRSDFQNTVCFDVASLAENEDARSRPIIGLFGSYFHPQSNPSEFNDYLKYLENLYNFVSSNPQYIFWYKDHPVEKSSELVRKIIDHDNVRIWRGDTIQFVEFIDLALMKSSAASIECAAFSKPFVIIEWSSDASRNIADRDYLKDSEFFPRVNDFNDLRSEIDIRLDKDWKGRDLLEQYYRLHISREDSLDFISQNLFSMATKY